jgi:tRNA-Thr(GGU) m(6)t(6)A37 methyltransferase TsaA
MSEEKPSQRETYQVQPIGTIRRNGDEIRLEIDAAFRPGLKQLELFSHVMVFWWAELFDNEESRAMLQLQPPYAEDHVTGVFASRSPFRPNPIMMTTCKLLGMEKEQGSLVVADIDAFDGTRLVDLKAYFPVCDRVQEAHIPEWLSDWPEWMPEDGIGLEEGEG